MKLNSKLFRKLMLRIVPVCAVTVILLAASSCSNSAEPETQYIPVQITEDGSWVFINEKGERIGSQEWEFEPTVTRDGIFTARTDSGLTVYRWKGDVAKPVDSLTNLVCVGKLADGLMPVTPVMQRIRIVNAKGDTKFVLDPIDGKEISSCALGFSEDMLIVNNIDGKAGVIDNKGKVIVKPKYDEISNFNGGYALAVTYNFEKEDGDIRYYVIDKEGKATAVKGKFGFPESDEGLVSEFNDGKVVVNAPYDTVKNEIQYLEISTDGKVTKQKNGFTYTYPLKNGGKITYSLVNDKFSYTWFDKDGKVVMKSKGDEIFNDAGKYVAVLKDDKTRIYSDEGKELSIFNGSQSVLWPGGKFGPVLYDYSNYEKTECTLLDAEGKKVNLGTIYNIGTREYINLENHEEIEYDTRYITSAYVDIPAAASKLASMLTNGTIKGKSLYYIGQSVAEILEGENARWYTGADKSFMIPADSTGWLASGAGFRINGSAKSSASITAPIYQNYFQVHHYDYWGTAWGWNRKRQVGVKMNPAAKVAAFDLQLSTNHVSGPALREAIKRRLVKEGYTEIASEPNYDEYSNGSNTIIIYGTPNSKGIGGIMGNSVSKLSKEEKTKLATTL